MSVVKLEGISKHYPGTAEPAVDNISLTIDDGEFMVLLGPSGCGKSTTLRMIAGLESISGGTLSIDDVVVNRVPSKDRDIAMVFQSYALYPHMSVRDNLAFGLKRRRIPRDEIARRVDTAAKTLALTSFLDRKPYALSGGQRQRVALGRAIVRDPKVFLFDEPLSNLDAALRTHTRTELIKQYHQLKSTMIYVTHDQIEAMTMGTRICVMHGGHIVQVGKPLEVYRNPADTFVASFVGNPPMNLQPASLSGAGGAAALQVFNVRADLSAELAGRLTGLNGGALTFGVRPEDIYLGLPATDAAGFVAFKAQVIAVEPLGAETIILAQTADGAEVTARVRGTVSVHSGETVELFMDPAGFRFFDGETGKAL